MRLFLLLVTLAIWLIDPLPSGATERVRVAVVDATYVMGDSDTLAAAEEHVLLKAKRKAIEESGIYLEATSNDIEIYGGDRTSRMNSLGIRTLSAAVTETEILEKRRTLDGDRLSFYVRIRTKVHVDWLSDAIKRMKADEQLAAHHRQLQLENSQLRTELEKLRKQSPDTNQPGMQSGQAKKNRRAAEDLVRTAIQTRSFPVKINDATRAIAEDNSYADAYIVRGQTYLRIASMRASPEKEQGIDGPAVHVERAIEDFERALILDRTSTWALLGRGDAYTWMGKLQDAARDYEQILKLDPLFDVAQQRLITLYTGMAKKHVSAHERQQALTILGKILRSDMAPSWVIYQKEGYLLRSQVYSELGELDKAVEDLTMVIRADPTNAQAFLRRAFLHRRLMQGRLAREDLEQACGLALEEACASF